MKIRPSFRLGAVLLGGTLLFSLPAAAQGNDPLVDIAHAASAHPGGAVAPRLHVHATATPSLDPNLPSGGGGGPSSPMPSATMTPGAGFVSPLPRGLNAPSSNDL